ncbi:hypothetical protein F3Y22_tig00001478pilonHSYRG00258 [Hibiscus syriacus]|uniref:Uncharacterized protein n=1 Tax=Hibiscus syriacus TaxID=106335 RepID=A0A6A3CXE0_HIBSY|nr:hypothetical protein F3Y22_tig00001478pilonHSYRG00258 [Hibiscus syriacus]
MTILFLFSSIVCSSKSKPAAKPVAASPYLRNTYGKARTYRTSAPSSTSKSPKSFFTTLTFRTLTKLIPARIYVPFSCDCLNGDFLGHTFVYFTQFDDTYDNIASNAFANLTTEDWVRRVNVYDDTKIPYHVTINVTVNCSPNWKFSTIKDQHNWNIESSYCRHIDCRSCWGFVVGTFYIGRSLQREEGTLKKSSETTALFASPGLTGITVDKSVELSYEELAKATDDFSIANKIGQGGFDPFTSQNYEKAAIKKMDMQASKEFLTELKGSCRQENEEVTKSTGLVALLEDVLNRSDPREDLQKLVDPWLGDAYSFHSICKSLVADGASRPSLHKGKSSAEAEHEINRSRTYDTVVFDQGLEVAIIVSGGGQPVIGSPSSEGV